jgi:hypothetical protein
MAKARRSDISAWQSGVAGEYFVAAELSRRGYIAALTMKNTMGIDILAASADASRVVGIQVKTTRDGHTSWLVNGLNKESAVTPHQFFVFVSMNMKGRPSFYVVPRADVVRLSKATMRDGRMPKFADPQGTYRNKWKLLGLDA